MPTDTNVGKQLKKSSFWQNEVSPGS